MLQPTARRVEVWELRRDRTMVGTQLADARTIQGARVPINPRLAATSAPTIASYARLIGADDEVVQSDLLALLAMLDRMDAGSRPACFGGAEPNAADFQIAPTLALLMAVVEL